MRKESKDEVRGGIEVRTEVRKGYIRVILKGEYQMAEVMKVAARIFDFCHQTKIRNVLLDARAVTGKPSLVTKIEMADLMVEKQTEYIIKGSPRLRVAHVLHPGVSEPAMFGEMLAAKRGAIIHVSNTIEEALRWLGVEEEGSR